MKLGLCAGLIAGLIWTAPALAAPTVTVRVEGANATLLERTTVVLGSEPVNGCDGDTASDCAAFFVCIGVAHAGFGAVRHWYRHHG